MASSCCCTVWRRQASYSQRQRSRLPWRSRKQVALPSSVTPKSKACCGMFSRPIFKAADINAGAVKVYVIADDNINAFVAGGQRIFIHTGLITKAQVARAKSSACSRMNPATSLAAISPASTTKWTRASTERIIGMLIGAAAVVGGAACGRSRCHQRGHGHHGGHAGHRPAQPPVLPALHGSLGRSGCHQIPVGHQAKPGWHALALPANWRMTTLPSLDRCRPLHVLASHAVRAHPHPGSGCEEVALLRARRRPWSGAAPRTRQGQTRRLHELTAEGIPALSDLRQHFSASTLRPRRLPCSGAATSRTPCRSSTA